MLIGEKEVEPIWYTTGRHRRTDRWMDDGGNPSVYDGGIMIKVGNDV